MVFLGDLRSNRVSPWRFPKPTLHIWSNASPTRGSAHTNSCEIFQHDWVDKEPESTGTQGSQIGATPVGESRQCCAATSRQNDGYNLHQEDRGTWSPTLYNKSLWLWCQVICRQLTILPPQWLASEENTEANFLSRLSCRGGTSNWWAQSFGKLSKDCMFGPPWCMCIQGESSGGKVHDLAPRL